MMKDRGPVRSGNCLSCRFKTLLKSMHRDAYTSVIILIMGFNYILEEFIFEEKKLNEISKNKFSLKITHYTVCSNLC